MKARIARLIDQNNTLERDRVEAFLPVNYAMVAIGDGNMGVVGVDVMGWTLDEYVIPRLASGLIFAEEITS